MFFNLYVLKIIIHVLENTMKKAIAITLLLTFFLAGCNTVAGVGKDVSKVGDVVTDSAEKSADKL